MDSQLVQRMENIALLMAETAQFNARIAGMVATNQQCAFSDKPPVYAEDEFALALVTFPDPMLILKRGL